MIQYRCNLQRWFNSNVFQLDALSRSLQQSAASTSTAPVEQSSPAMVKTEDMPEPSSVEREKFITELKQFHLDRGTPMTRPPVLSQKTLDLFRLYHLVQEYGGMEKVRLLVNSVLLVVLVC